MSRKNTTTRSTAIYPVASPAANFSTADIFANGDTGVQLDIHVTGTFTGTSVTFTIFYWDITSGTWLTTGLATAAITAVGHASLTIDPRIAVVANAAQSAILPARFRVTSTGTWTVLTVAIVATFAG